MLIGKRKKTFTVQIDGIYNIGGEQKRKKEQEETVDFTECPFFTIPQHPSL